MQEQAGQKIEGTLLLDEPIREPCPRCRELIQPGARICRFCGYTPPLFSGLTKALAGLAGLILIGSCMMMRSGEPERSPVTTPRVTPTSDATPAADLKNESDYILMGRWLVASDRCDNEIRNGEPRIDCARREAIASRLEANWCRNPDSSQPLRPWIACGYPVVDPTPHGSEQLVAYEQRIRQPLVDKANAHVLTECHWRTAAWNGLVDAVITRQIEDDPARAMLSEEELRSFGDWQRDVVSDVAGGTLGERCSRLHPMPWQDRLDSMARTGSYEPIPKLPGDQYSPAFSRQPSTCQ